MPTLGRQLAGDSPPSLVQYPPFALSKYTEIRLAIHEADCERASAAADAATAAAASAVVARNPCVSKEACVESESSSQRLTPTSMRKLDVSVGRISLGNRFTRCQRWGCITIGSLGPPRRGWLWRGWGRRNAWCSSVCKWNNALANKEERARIPRRVDVGMRAGGQLDHRQAAAAGADLSCWRVGRQNARPCE